MPSAPSDPPPSGAPEGELYLDWNATTPPHPEVLAAMADAARTAWGNPASVHRSGRRASAIVEDARQAIAELVERDPRDVILTGGGTEANNLALAGARALVTSRLEHPSVTRVAEALESRGVPVSWLPVPENGRIEPEAVGRALHALGSGAQVAIAAVNHETGVIQPVEAVAEIVRSAQGALHVDAVQAVGRLPLDALRGADSLSLAAHKLRGPKGIGALVARPGKLPSPVLLGGSQERGIRPGTADAGAAAGFCVAARLAGAGSERYARIAPLREAIERALAELVLVNGAGAPRAPHVTNFSMPGVRGDELAAALDLEGVRVSSGSACTAGTSEPSKVIEAMLGRERARSALRVSLGELTTPADIERFLLVFRAVLPRLAQLSSSA
ncbi:MAG TPA: cysteine desulfurase family protein [Polyangiaceae bacterium]